MEVKNYFATDSQGNVLGSAQVYLYLAGTTTLATGLQNISGAALANPFTSQSNGLVQFQAPDNNYDLRVVKPGREFTIRIQCFDGIAYMNGLTADGIPYDGSNVGAILDQLEEMRGRSLRVEDHGIMPGATSVTTQLQALIDDWSASGGGIVQFGRGGFNITGLKPSANIILEGAGASATFLNYAGEPGLTGIEFIYRATSYNLGGVRNLTPYNTGSFGAAAVSTPKNTEAFTRTQRWVFNDIAVRGVSSNENGIIVGDSASTSIQRAWFQGGYVAQNPDAGQNSDTAILLSGVRGVVEVDISAYKIRGMRQGVRVSDFAEGFSLHAGEVVGSWEGVILDSTPSKPGGFIYDNHFNCSHKCIRGARRRHITIGTNQYYRDSTYSAHGLGWTGADMSESSGVTIGGIQTRVIPGFADECLGLSLSDCPDAVVGVISSGEAGSLTKGAKISASTLGACAGVSIGGLAADSLPVWLEFSGAVNDFTLMDNVVERGTASASPILITGTGLEKASIRLPSASTATPKYQLFPNRNANLSKDIKPRAHAPKFKESLVAGSGAYSVNYYLDTASAVTGDQFNIRLTQIGGSNSTFNIFTGASTGTPTSLVSLVAAAAGTTQRRAYDLVFNGTAWEAFDNVDSLT